MTPDILAKNTVRWLPDYAVGIREIDQEHRGLFVLAEKLHRAIQTGKEGESLQGLLDELIDYTCRHFTHEEELMEKIAYPYYQDHRRQHEDLRQKICTFKGPAASSDLLTIELMGFLVDWLKCHTTTSDRRIGTYMRTHGLIP